MRLAAALLVLLAALPPALAADDTRLPVPDQVARGAAANELRKELREELKSKDAEPKRALARKLLERAKDGDAVKRYVLILQAVDFAEAARDIRLALDAVGQLAATFQEPRALRSLASMDAITRGAKETGLLAEAAGACIEIAGTALADDDASTAGKAIAAAKAHAKTAKLGGLVARAGELGELVNAFRRQAAAAETARATLTATPEDPAAHEALGRFLAFGRGRWDEGAAHLAKSPAAPLAELAAKELLHPAEPAAKQALADGWWSFAQREKDPLARARMLAHAVALDPAKARVDAVTCFAWDRTVALTRDFSKDGPTSLGLALIRDFIAKEKIDRKSDGWRLRVPRPPDVTFSRGEEYLWRLETNLGVITLRLFADTAPKHVAVFVYLTELGYFDGLVFHRVIPAFMAQGGCPKKDGTGDPGWFIDGEYAPERKHDKPGVLSTANTGKPTSDGSQFFITFAPAPNLDGKHTIFGEVIEGMDVVKKLEEQGTADGPTKIPLVIDAARVTLR